MIFLPKAYQNFGVPKLAFPSCSSGFYFCESATPQLNACVTFTTASGKCHAPI